MAKPSRRDIAVLGASAALGCGFAAAVSQEVSASTADAELQLYLFIYRPGPAWREGVPMREQGLGPHAAYMQSLMDEGRLFAGGGFVGVDGGMAVVLAANIEAAAGLLAADPAITSGVFAADIRHWRPRFRATTPLPG